MGPQATANGTNSAGRQAKPFKLPECCSYGQVYARIIELLSATESSNDTELSRALLDELEVSVATEWASLTNKWATEWVG